MHAYLRSIRYRLWFDNQLYDHYWNADWSENPERLGEMHWGQELVQYPGPGLRHHDDTFGHDDTHSVCDDREEQPRIARF